MPLEYDLEGLQDQAFSAPLSPPISTRYLKCFLELSKQFVITKDKDALGDFPIIESDLQDWLEKIRGHITHQSHETLNEKQKALGDALKKASNVKSYDKISAAFAALHEHLIVIEKLMVQEALGLDTLTGLHNQTFITSKFDKEMQLLARDGKPFSVALVQIDDFDKILEAMGRDPAGNFEKQVAETIKQSLRSFDDAYRIGVGEFILTLKQARTAGGIRALERLKEALEEAQITLNKNITGRRHLSLSCRVTEPIAGDHIDDIIQNLRDDINMGEKHGDSIFEYHEMSPLERFVQGQ